MHRVVTLSVCGPYQCLDVLRTCTASYNSDFFGYTRLTIWEKQNSNILVCHEVKLYV